MMRLEQSSQQERQRPTIVCGVPWKSPEHLGWEVPRSLGSRRQVGKRELGMGVALTAEELILGCHCALHDLWLDEPSAESICI